MRKRLAFGLLIASSSVLMMNNSCRHAETPAPSAPQENDTSGNNNNPIVPPVTPDTGICFQRDILPLFISNCAKSGCRDAITRSEGYQFTDYQSITSRKFVPGNAGATELYKKITETDNGDVMPPPPASRLTSQQISLIGRWINEGAKNTTNCTSGCDTNNYAYSTAIRPMVEQYCKGCHSSAAPSGGIALDNYAGIKTVALNGRLHGAVNRLPGYQPMPQGGSKLSDCQLRQVERWIEAGAPEN